eukprot:CAMPEP_0194157372 /NCGR_PEP_ID=MMETSP0152-20130528/71667_1 /TAXON_ID=1049557 /ORGANISM="Thalassiothrix antarctica, Strain L6-D1" /LENGTH=73 /DNA_ID=CAMNT_0038865689 /DNA_START=130 /DNA_END=348 /DNA_ORIENTATION=-
MTTKETTEETQKKILIISPKTPPPSPRGERKISAFEASFHAMECPTNPIEIPNAVLGIRMYKGSNTSRSLFFP